MGPKPSKSKNKLFIKQFDKNKLKEIKKESRVSNINLRVITLLKMNLFKYL